MDRSRANKRSNTFGVQTDLESGWQQPSIPWLSYISSDSQEPSLTNNLRIRDHSFSAPSDRENSVDSTKPDFFASNFFPTRSGSSTSRLVQRRQGPQIRTNPRLQSPHRPASPSASDSRWSRVSSRPSDNRGEGYIDLTTKEGRLEICAKKSSVVHKATDDSGKNQHSHNKRKRADSNHTSIEEIDLRDVDSEHDLTRVLEQQREATVRDQQAQAEKPTKLANVTCVVCMDELTDMTATHCGHLFCHVCLMEALIAGENQGAEPGKGQSKCPICRKRITRPKEGRVSKSGVPQVIPLEIKVKASGQVSKGKGRA